MAFTADEARKYIDEVRWQFAKPMPQRPHEYTVRACELVAVGNTTSDPLLASHQWWRGNSDVMRALAPLRHEDPPRLLDADGQLIVPIFLPVGVERDAVRASLDDQLRQVHDLLASCTPPSRTTPADDDPGGEPSRTDTLV